MKRRPVAEINLVPFIDVMLVLLVVFMITTPLLTQGVRVALPETAAGALTKDSLEPLVVTVDGAGEFYLNLSAKPSQPVTARVLSSLVSAMLARGRRPVLVRGDKSVNYGKMMEAMVILQQAGADSVGLVTQPLAQAGQPLPQDPV